MVYKFEKSKPLMSLETLMLVMERLPGACRGGVGVGQKIFCPCGVKQLLPQT
jgi:hypothetical protein